ncbi:hypothetical protein P43SY_005322 [Pythium insidiosum]|uniref:Glycoside-Pentoside-Hexuronide (GPH):Cation Symporter Family n=1 Tax=Pythium insidiosum TaxID=114742 RepID=A0AAD5Q9B8_PYTIN|nr:hypothetical protein P43SY_005322 [Pythium insidiosum]
MSMPPPPPPRTEHAEDSSPVASGRFEEHKTPRSVRYAGEAVLEASGVELLTPTNDRPELRTRANSNRRRSLAMTKPIQTCFILALPWAAYSVVNTVIEDVRLPYMSSMGIGEFVPRFLPPLTALFLSPILGAASDRSLSKWGRRNVFLVTAAIMLVVSGLSFGSAQVLFPNYQGFTNLVFFFLNVGLLLLSISLRARLMDEVPLQYQVHAQAALTFWAGVGALVGNKLFRDVSSAKEISGKQVLISFSEAMAGVIATTALCIKLRKEHPQDRPAFQPPLDRLVREVREQIVYAPRIFRILCLVYFVQFFAWMSFRAEVFAWWTRNVYKGCTGSGCSSDEQQDYADAMDIATLALMCQNALQMLVSLIILWVIPKDICYKLNRASVVGLALGSVALIGAVSVGGAWKIVTFAAFVAVAFYQIVVSIFPYSVVGIMGKQMQETAHGFNNNGLYIGVLGSFSAVSQLFVQLYGTEKMAPLGTGNVMALPCGLFVAGIIVTYKFTFARRKQ